MSEPVAVNLDVLAKRVKNRYFKDLRHGQTRQILETLMGKTRDYLIVNNVNKLDYDNLDDEYDVETIENYFTYACEFVDQLRTALNPLGRGERFPKNPTYIFKDYDLENRLMFKKAELAEIEKNKEDYIYERREAWSHWISHLDNEREKHVSYDDLFMDGYESIFYWPVGDFDSIIANYIKYSWLQCYAVDRIIIRSIIYKCICEYGEIVSNIIFPPPRSLLFFTAKHKTYREKLKKSENWLMLSIAGYGIFALILAIAAAEATNWWTGVIVWLFVDTLIVFKKYFSGRDQARAHQKLSSNLAKLHGVMKATSQPGLTPSFIRARLSEVDGYGLRFPANLWMILDLAEQRSGIYWSLGD